MDLTNYKVKYFGEKWPAGLFDDPAGVEEVPTPVDKVCFYCREKFKEGDQGTFDIVLNPSHKECSFRAVMGGIGHHVNCGKYCKGELGTDAGLSKRISSILAFKWFAEDYKISEFQLDLLRDILDKNSDLNKIYNELPEDF